MQLKINAMIEGLNIVTTKDKNDKSHKENMKKIDTQNQKKMSIEHLNDN